MVLLKHGKRERNHEAAKPSHPHLVSPGRRTAPPHGFPNLTAAHYFMNRESIEITSSKYKLERVETVETIEVLASSGTWTKKNDEIVEKNRISV